MPTGTTKTCTVCGLNKPVAEYYLAVPGRLMARCKRCFIAANNRRPGTKATKRRYNKSAKGKQVQRRYAKTDARKVSSKRYSLSELGRRRHRAAIAADRRRYPERYAARRAVKEAVKNGALKRQPCGGCGAARAEAHHHAGYDRTNWLNVVWLCKVCHERVHHE